MTITNGTFMPQPVQQQFTLKLLARPQPGTIHSYMAYDQWMDQNSGDILRNRRYNNLPTAPVPLGDGIIDPAPVPQSSINIDTKIEWYGQYSAVTERVYLTNEDKVINGMMGTMSQSLRETEDLLVRENLASTAAFVNATNGANGDNPTEPNRTDFDECYRLLYNASAMRITENIPGTLRFGTAPVRSAYFGMCNSNIMADLEQVTGWLNVAQYPDGGKNALDDEWGTVANFRLLVSPLGKIEANASANGANVYDIFLVGQESYSKVYLDEYSAQFIYTPPEIASPNLRRYCTIGWKMVMGNKVLNDSWVINHRVTRSV